jgi:hypothetical protein
MWQCPATVDTKLDANLDSKNETKSKLGTEGKKYPEVYEVAFPRRKEP